MATLLGLLNSSMDIQEPKASLLMIIMFNPLVTFTRLANWRNHSVNLIVVSLPNWTVLKNEHSRNPLAQMDVTQVEIAR
jgi:hypothetical protein